MRVSPITREETEVLGKIKTLHAAERPTRHEIGSVGASEA